MRNTLTNRQLLERLDNHVYGHEVAKKALIVLVNRSRTRYFQKYGQKLPKEQLVPTLNCLLIGQSGTGKTFLMDTLSEICKFPVIKLSSTDLTNTGNSDGINSLKLRKLIYDNAEEAVTKKLAFSIEGAIDQTIIFIDEIDKLANSFESSGNWNKQIQASLLNLTSNTDEFDSLSFVFAGAFDGLELDKKNKESIGFTKESAKEVYKHTDDAIIKYGLMPELVGRINNVLPLDTLTITDYETILDKHVLPRADLILSAFGTDYTMNAEDKKELAKKAKESGLGVRFLIKEVDKTIQELEFIYEDKGRTTMDMPEITP